jgi:predicted nucleic acid-binding protein
VIFLDTNVILETLKRRPDRNVLAWLERNDAEVALPAIAIAEIAFGISRIRPQERAGWLEQGLTEWRHRFSDRIFAFTEQAALVYGDLMEEAARKGRPMSLPDGMIAATALVNGGRLATRNLKEFRETGLELLSPWDF